MGAVILLVVSLGTGDAAALGQGGQEKSVHDGVYFEAPLIVCLISRRR